MDVNVLFASNDLGGGVRVIQCYSSKKWYTHKQCRETKALSLCCLFLRPGGGESRAQAGAERGALHGAEHLHSHPPLPPAGPPPASANRRPLPPSPKPRPPLVPAARRGKGGQAGHDQLCSGVPQRQRGTHLLRAAGGRRQRGGDQPPDSAHHVLLHVRTRHHPAPRSTPTSCRSPSSSSFPASSRCAVLHIVRRRK